MMKFNFTTQETHWGKYKEQITLTTDSEKFDDMLRMICSVSKEARLVFERMGSQVHFVDAADGGYAMAAVGLKKQLIGFNA